MGKEVRHRVTIESDEAERKLSALQRAWESVRGAVGRASGGLRGGKVGLDDVTKAAGGASTGLGGASLSALKLGGALAILSAAFKVVVAAAREMGRAIESAVQFQTQTFQMRMLTGSMKEAREVMLQLTEGKQAVDHIFGSTAVVDAYRKLHNYTGGALASAYAVRVLGEASLKTGKDIGSMADTVGRAWQAITSGANMDTGSVKGLMDEGLVSQEFINQLKRMKYEGRSASDIFMALWNEIEQRGAGSVNTLAGSIDDLRKRIADTKGTIRTQMGEWFMPMVAAWNRAKLGMLKDIEHITKNPIRFKVAMAGAISPALLPLAGMYLRAEKWYQKRTGHGFFSGKDFGPSPEMSMDDYLAMGADEREHAKGRAKATGNADLSKQMIMWEAADAAEKQRQQQLSDFRSNVDARREEERIEGMTSSEMFAEANRYGPLGEIDDELKFEQLLDRANQKLAEERERAAEEAEATRKAEENLRKTMEEATFRSSLQYMTAGEQAEALRGRRDAAYGDATALRAAGDELSALAAELRALNLNGQVVAAERQAENEEQRRKDENFAFFEQQQEHELRKMTPGDESAERRARIQRNKELLDEMPDDPELHDVRMDLKRRIFADERRVEELDGRKGNKSKPNRRGMDDFISDLVNIPELTNPGVIGLDGKSRTKSITERFADRLTQGQLTTSEAGRLSKEAGASAIERMQIELDNERNRILRDLKSRLGVTE